QDNTEDQGPANIFINVDPDGLGDETFGDQIKVTTTNVGGVDMIPAQAHLGIDAEANLAWDHSSGAHRGRVYLSYTDESPSGSNNTDIMLRYSDNNGTSWSPAVKVNDDTGSNSQFLPDLAVDQSNGNLAIGWYDCRNDTGSGSGSLDSSPNNDFMYWGA